LSRYVCCGAKSNILINNNFYKFFKNFYSFNVSQFIKYNKIIFLFFQHGIISNPNISLSLSGCQKKTQHLPHIFNGEEHMPADCSRIYNPHVETTESNKIVSPKEQKKKMERGFWIISNDIKL